MLQILRNEAAWWVGQAKHPVDAANERAVEVLLHRCPSEPESNVRFQSAPFWVSHHNYSKHMYLDGIV